MARELINGISVPIAGTGEPADFVADLRSFATDLSASTAAGIVDLDGLIAEAIAKVTNLYVTPQLFDPLAGTPGHDSTAAVQAALDYASGQTDPADVEIPQPAPVGCGAVFFPKGTYECDALTVTGTISLWGVGGAIYAASVIRQRTDGQTLLTLAGDTDGALSQATLIQHLTFKSNSATSAGTAAQIKTASGIGSNSIYIKSCWFKTPERYAVWITQGDDLRITGCTFDVSAFHAVRLGNGSGQQVSNAEIVDNTFYDIALTLVETDNVVGLTLTGNRAYGNAATPTTTSRFVAPPASGATTVRHLAIAANTLNRLGGLALLPTLAQAVSIVGNTGRDLYASVVELFGGGVLYVLSVTGNTFLNSAAYTSGAAITGAGCGLQGSAITGNGFYSDTATALLLDLPDPRVQDNHLAGNGRVGFTAQHNLAAPTFNGFAA